jgi:hypothetical protein
MTTNELDLSAYKSLSIILSYLTRNMDTTDEGFWIQLSDDGGRTFTTVKEWNLGDEFINNERYKDRIDLVQVQNYDLEQMLLINMIGCIYTM